LAVAPKIQVVGLCGFAFVGKDTVADVLAVHARFHKVAFADALRAEICAAFGVDVATLTDRSRKQEPIADLALVKCRDMGYVGAVIRHIAQQEAATPVLDLWTAPRSPRETLQLWGTQYRRAVDPLYWIRQVRTRIRFRAAELGETSFVVTDVRYPNEADLVREFAGELWQITRPSCGGELEGGHSSATDGSEFKPDRVLANSAGIRHLQAMVLGELCALTYQLDGCRLEITHA